MFDHRLINIGHILLVGPILIALGLGDIPENLLHLLVYLGIFVIIYHLYKLVTYSKVIEGMEVDGQIIHNIRMFDSSPGYDKPVICINRGEVIVWSNLGETEHSVTGKNNEFNSGYMKPGERFSVKFDYPGEYDYYCMVNRGWMIGKVKVK